MQSGQQLYGTLCSAFRLVHPRTNAKKLSCDNLALQPGINEHVIKEVAPKRFGRCRLINCGDATRGRRELVKNPFGPYLIGTVFSPDVNKWPAEPGISISQSMEDLTTLTDAIRGKNGR